MATKSATAVDLFCGAGGLSQGLVDAGFLVLAAADHDPDACASYRRNFPDAALVEGDLTSAVKHGELLAALSSGRVDLLAGGPPCQAYSQVRNHDLIEGSAQPPEPAVRSACSANCSRGRWSWRRPT